MIIKDLVYNLTEETPGFTFFFLCWPVVVALGIFIHGARKGDGGLSNLLDALYYSSTTYLGVGVPESNPTRFKWPKFFHRLVGIFACAYITAVFIITII